MFSIGAGWRSSGDPRAWMTHFAPGVMPLVQQLRQRFEGSWRLSYYLSQAGRQGVLQHVASVRPGQRRRTALACDR